MDDSGELLDSVQQSVPFFDDRLQKYDIATTIVRKLVAQTTGGPFTNLVMSILRVGTHRFDNPCDLCTKNQTVLVKETAQTLSIFACNRPAAINLEISWSQNSTLTPKFLAIAAKVTLEKTDNTRK
jgi:hypothetical protein